VVDDEGEEIFADKIGLILARDLAPLNKGAKFVVDVKSTGLYATDPILTENDVTVVYWKTGHSYIKRKTAEIGALADSRRAATSSSTPRSARLRLRLTAAAAILGMLDRNPERKLSDLKKACRSPTPP